MKQLISILLTLVLVLSLVACANDPADTQPSEPTSDPSTPTEPQVDPLDALQVLSLSFEGNVRDASAAANHGTLNKDGSFIEGVSGQALQLDGATYIDLGTSGSLQPAKLTFSAWIKSDGGLAGEHMITWFKPNGRYQGEGWYLSCLDNNTPLKLSVGPSSGQPMEIFVSGSREEFFPAGQWVHIAVTYDSESHTCAIYRNGIAQDVQYINAQSEITADEASHKYIGFNSPGYNGFIRLSRDWSDGDVISYSIPMQVVVYNLPDNENVVAFKYGPWVLSANMGQTNMTTSTTGVNVTIPSLDGSLTDVLTIQQGTIADWLKNIDKNLLKTDGKLEFTLKGTDHAWVFTPHYQQHENRYGIYFELRDANTQVGDDESDTYEVIDSLPVANDQYEFSHNLLGEKTGTGMHKGLNYRHAEPGGWFSYDMAVDGSAPNFLRIKLFSGDVGRKFTIEVNGQVLKDVTIENINPDNFYDVYYEIPAELIDGKETVTVTFRADKGSYAGGIFEKLSIVKEKA